MSGNPYGAKPYMFALFSTKAREYDLSRLFGRTGYAVELIPYIAEIPNCDERESYWTILSMITRLDDRIIEEMAFEVLYGKRSKRRQLI